VDFSKIPDVTQWQMNQLGVSLGYKDGAEMVQDQIAVRQRTQQLEQEMQNWREQQTIQETSSNFLVNAPDFPNTDESIAAIEQVIAQNGWDWNTQSMMAAHALATRQGLYKPLNQEEQQGAMGIAPKIQRPSAPPIPRSGSPESSFASADPWSMPVQDLRKMAIQQALEGDGRR
jgi:hypothetical protein